VPGVLQIPHYYLGFLKTPAMEFLNPRFCHVEAQEDLWVSVAINEEES